MYLRIFRDFVLKNIDFWIVFNRGFEFIGFGRGLKICIKDNFDVCGIKIILRNIGLDF